ncbi:hypothetical protein RI367_004816 [Sorochytrium milnesiophthora]
MSGSRVAAVAFALLCLLVAATQVAAATGSAPAPGAAASQAPAQICPKPGEFCFSARTNLTAKTVDFTLQFKTPGWVGLGLSPTKSMSDADVWMVWIDSSRGQPQAMVSDRRSTTHSLPRADTQQDVNVVMAVMNNNQYTVLVRRAIDTGDPDDYKFENKTQSFIWAFSSDPVGTQRQPLFTQHSDEGDFSINVFDSVALANAATTGAAGVGDGDQKARTRLIHGVLMFVAWGLLSYGGVFVARFMKAKLGVWWFRIHAAVMTLVAILSTVAFILVYGTVKSGHFTGNIHSTLGLVVFIVMWLQWLLGIVIDKLFDPKRLGIPWYDRMHWVLGYTMALAAPLTVFLGLVQFAASWTWKGLYIASWIAFMGLFAFGQRKFGQTHHQEPPTSTVSAATMPSTGKNGSSTTMTLAADTSAAANTSYDKMPLSPPPISPRSPSRPPRPTNADLDASRYDRSPYDSQAQQQSRQRRPSNNRLGSPDDDAGYGNTGSFSYSDGRPARSNPPARTYNTTNSSYSAYPSSTGGSMYTEDAQYKQQQQYDQYSQPRRPNNQGDRDRSRDRDYRRQY